MAENKEQNQATQEDNVVRESMVWYRSFVDSVEKLNDVNIKYLCYYSIFNYGLNGEIPTTDNEIVNALFAFAKPLIDKNINRYEACKKNGAKGGNPNFKKGQPNPYYNKKDNQTNNQIDNQIDNLNENVNDNDNVNDNVNVNVNVNDNVNDNLHSELFSLFSKKFTTSYPTKDITINKEEELNKLNLEQIDIDLLIKKISDSDFLIDCDNLGLQWCLLNYKRIISGIYDRKLLKTAKNESQGHMQQRSTLSDDLKRVENILNIIDIEPTGE